MIATLIIVFDECLDLPFEISRQIIMLKKHSVLERLMPTLDFSLCLRVVRSPTHMIHGLLTEPFCEFVSNITGTIIGEQSRSVFYCGLIEP